MKRLASAIVVVSAAWAAGGGAVPAGAVPAVLKTGGFAEVLSVSCASAGNCAAGGDYAGRGGRQGFAVVERNGRWARAIPVPGLAALNAGGDAQVNSVSCASPGNCAAGGTYQDGSLNNQGFAVVERNGRWGKAIQVPGPAFNTGGSAEVNSVSCGSAVNCVAGGYYSDRLGQQGFAAVERNGRWARAIQVPGPALNTGGFAEVGSVSCASPGNCTAGGGYGGLGFVAVERNGRWGKAIEVPGLAAFDTGGTQGVVSVSCASAGNCAAGGDYADRHGIPQGFVVTQGNGRWGKAIGVPGLAALSTGGDAEVNSVSCGSAGNCVAVGFYSDRHGQHGFAAVERNGRWAKAIEVPGPGS